MEKEIRKLMKISSIISVALLIITIIAFLSLLTIHLVPYHRIIVYVIVAELILLMLTWGVSLELVRASKSGKAESFDIYILRVGISFMLPLFIYLTGIFKGDKDELRRIYININNLVVRNRLQKKHTTEMLILLPHCMQNKDCSSRVTEGIENCRRCGCCKIGEVADITEHSGIRTVVAKGGTAARNTVKECKPDFILAIACERELMSGIGDVGSIPVIGVINQRPNGYCTNTTVDMPQLKKTLQELLGTGCEVRGTGIEENISCET